MTNAVWLLVYDVADANSETYLNWFHGDHIPDKLARPGYDWAAHYRGPARSAEAASGYLALFGARTTQTFLNPCPAQHREGQDVRTREMMSYRIGTVAGIFTLEWSDGEGNEARGADASAIRAELLDADTRDEALGAWCVQTWLPAFRTQTDTCVARKYTNVSGRPRHLLLTCHGTVEAAATSVKVPADGIFSTDVSRVLDTAIIAHGKRTWPPPDAAVG